MSSGSKSVRVVICILLFGQVVLAIDFGHRDVDDRYPRETLAISWYSRGSRDTQIGKTQESVKSARDQMI
jgi:hypothetical protein